MDAINGSPLSLFDISGKSALIIGGTGTLGSAAARTFAAAGCSLTLADRNSDGLAALAEELRATGTDVYVRDKHYPQVRLTDFIAALIEALQNKDEGVGFAAADYLAKIGPAAKDAVVVVARSIGSVRRPDQLVTYTTSGLRSVGVHRFHRSGDDGDGSHVVLPPILGDQELWRPAREDPQALVVYDEDFEGTIPDT